MFFAHDGRVILGSVGRLVVKSGAAKGDFAMAKRKNVEEARRLRRDGQQLFRDRIRVQPTQPDLPLLVADRALEPLEPPAEDYTAETQLRMSHYSR